MTILDTERQSELADLRAAVHDVCDDAGGPAAVRTLDPGGPGYDPGLWDVLGIQIGLAGLGLPERVDGLGGLAEIATVAEELGRNLLPVPFLTSTVLAGQVLAAAGPAADAVLGRIVAGDVGAAGVTGADGVWDPAAVELRADPASETVDGVLPVVPGGAGAVLFVVAALTPDGPDLFAVVVGAGVDVLPLDSLDLSRPSALVTFTDAAATRLTAGGTADAVVPGALDVAAVALAAEQLGGAAACLDLTVGYVKERRQFGRAIGSFQAVKHACADLLVLVETSRSAVVRALEAEGSPVAMAEAASVAQAWCSEAYRTASAEMVQLHGGIGFTWEHDAHLHFRRARADAVLLGGATYHRERLARLLGW